VHNLKKKKQLKKKFKKGDYVIPIKLFKPAYSGCSADSINLYKKMVGMIGKITSKITTQDFKDKKYGAFEVKQMGDELTWYENEVRHATKKEIELHEQKLVENEI